MFEAMIIISFVYAGRFWKLRGKSYDQLTIKEQDIVIAALKKDRRRNQFTPEEYLPKVQKYATTYLTVGIILSIIYVPLVLILLATM